MSRRKCLYPLGQSKKFFLCKITDHARVVKFQRRTKDRTVSLEARKAGGENADGGETLTMHLKSRCSGSSIKRGIQNVISIPSPDGLSWEEALKS